MLVQGDSDMPDVRDNLFTTETLEVPQTATGDIDRANDIDAIRIFLTAGQQYVFNLTGAASGGGTLADPYLSLFNSQLELVAWDDDDGTGLDSRIIFTPSITGFYYLAAGTADFGVGTYTIRTSIQGVPAGDIPASAFTASKLVVGGSTTGVVDFAGDQDWHAVTLTAGQTYRINLQGAGSGPVDDTVLRLYDPAGALIAYNDDTDLFTNSELTFTASYTGTYFVSAGGFADATGSYSLQIATATPTDISFNAEFYLPPETEFRSAIEQSGDTDTVTLTLVSNQFYTFQAIGEGNLDTVLQLIDAQGNVVATNDDNGTSNNSQIVFYPPTSGTYYLTVSGFGSTTGAYTLTSMLSGTNFVGTSNADYQEGSLLADNLNGAAGNDTLLGGPGNDILTGGPGTDFMDGGEGSDTFEVDNVADRVIEAVGQGIDQLYAYVDYTLPANVENLMMGFGNQIYGHGNALDNLIVGNAQANSIAGFDGNDRLEGGAGNDAIDGGNGNDVILGGFGADTMIGGQGSDIYEVDNGGDLVFEQAGAGTTDNVYAYVDFTLPTNVENLVMLYGNQRFGTGNGGDNIIFGNGQGNVIEGGAGYDTLTGGAGSDLFIVRPGFGVDVITDFRAGAGSEDAVLFSTSLFTSFAQVKANAAQVGADTWIGDGRGNTVVLVGVQLDTLHADDFGFI